MDETADVRHIVAQDFDQDGNMDLALTIRELGAVQDTSVIWLRNDGDLTFSANILERDLFRYFRWIAAPDLDGDGDPDLVASRWNSGGRSGEPDVLLKRR